MKAGDYVVKWSDGFEDSINIYKYAKDNNIDLDGVLLSYDFTGIRALAILKQV